MYEEVVNMKTNGFVKIAQNSSSFSKVVTTFSSQNLLQC